MSSKVKHTRWMSGAAASGITLGVLAELSFGIRSSWYVAGFAAVATYIISIELVEWWRDRDREAFTYEEPTQAEIRAHYERVEQYAEAIGPVRPGMVEAATFLLNEAKGDFERVTSSSDNHEGKARAVLGIVAGATSALGIFGLSKDGQAVVPTPIVADSLIFVLVAFVCLLYVLRVKRYKRPNLATYFAGAMVREELRVALTLSLTPAYAKMTAELAHRIRHEPRAIFVAYVAVATAAVLVFLNAASSTRGDLQSAAPSMPAPATTMPPSAPHAQQTVSASMSPLGRRAVTQVRPHSPEATFRGSENVWAYGIDVTSSGAKCYV